MKDLLTVKALGSFPSLIIFLITTAILRFAHYGFAAGYKEATGKPYLAGYLIAWVSTMFLFLIAALVAYQLEGRPWERSEFLARYRLGRLSRGDLAWWLAMMVIAAGGLAALSFTMDWLRVRPPFAPHPTFPPDMVDITKLSPGTLWEMPLNGEWWVLLVYVLGWLFNIAGEEFWYRGWMLPKQERAFGRYAWLVNGLMFNFQHFFQPWNLLAMLPGSLFVSYAVQRRGKTWMSILWHGLLNVSLVFFIAQGVVGKAP